MILSNSGKTLYTAYDVSATSSYVYDSTGATDSEAGWASARADHNAILIGLTVLNATSLTYRIEGRHDTYNRACEIYSASLTEITTIDELINIAENLKEIRLGVKVNNSATPNTVYAGLCSSEVK